MKLDFISNDVKCGSKSSPKCESYVELDNEVRGNQIEFEPWQPQFHLEIFWQCQFNNKLVYQINPADYSNSISFCELRIQIAAQHDRSVRYLRFPISFLNPPCNCCCCHRVGYMTVECAIWSKGKIYFKLFINGFRIFVSFSFLHFKCIGKVCRTVESNTKFRDIAQV